MPKVLVVDDDSDLRETLVAVLSERGIEPISARHGKDALARLQDAGNTPCVILLDLMMPVMNGAEFRKRQLRNPAIASIPVVVITAHRHATDVQLDIHPDGFLEKPIDLDELIDVIREHCPEVP